MEKVLDDGLWQARRESAIPLENGGEKRYGKGNEIYALDGSYPDFNPCGNDVEASVVRLQLRFDEANGKGWSNS